MGEIRKRGRVWWIRYCKGGRRYEESARTDKYEIARDLLRVREGDVAKGGVPVSSQVGRFKFEEAAKLIEDDYAVNQRRSAGELARRIRLHLKPYFGGRRMASLSTSDIKAYTRRRLEAEASPAEINRELAIIKRMFTLAIQASLLVLRPHIPMLAEHNVRVGFFEREEFERVRANMPEPLRPLITFAYFTGWRIQSEVLTLQWRQVDLDAGTVRLDPGQTKNQQGRLFPFGDYLPELRQLLENQKRITAEVESHRGLICRWVFHRDGRQIKNFRKAWANACESAEIPGRIPHDFRRTAVRNLERAGVSRSVAMQLVGHQTEAVYRRYAIVSEADLLAGVEKLHGLAAGTIGGTKGRKSRIRRFRQTS